MSADDKSLKQRYNSSICMPIFSVIIFEISLDSDQAWQNVGPDLNPICLTLWWYSWKNFLKKLTDDKKACNNTQHVKS